MAERASDLPSVVGRPALLTLIAAAYSAAVMADADMHKATDALEKIRESFRQTPEQFKLWDAIDDQMGSVNDAALRAVLVQLLDAYALRVREAEIGRLRQEIGRASCRERV